VAFPCPSSLEVSMRTSAVSPAEEGEATAPSVQLDDFYARARAAAQAPSDSLGMAGQNRLGVLFRFQAGSR